MKSLQGFLKKSERWSLETLHDYQLEKLQELISFSYTHSSYYRKLFDNLHLHPSDIKTLKDLSKLPILTKLDLLKNSREIQSDYNFKKTFSANTSGSSGEALKFDRDEFSDSFNRASINRGYSWYEVNPWDCNGYFWGFNFSGLHKLKTLVLDRLQHRFRIFSYQSEEFNSFVENLKRAKYIHGYSSMIYQTAKLINEKKLTKPTHLKMVKGTSEKIFEKYHTETKKAFGLKIISEYGATESGIIAFECPKGSMHINMEGVIIEEINHEIIVTNLQMKSFPIIRYKLGDYITLEPKEKKCSCGKKHLILKEINGRVGNNVYGKNNIYPSLYFYYIFKNLDKNNQIQLNYQVVQEQKGALIFKIEQQINSNEKELLVLEIEKYFGTDISYIILDNCLIKAENNKLKSFISKIENYA